MIALVVALSVLQMYDRPLLSAVAAAFKANPAGWVERTLPARSAVGVGEEGEDPVVALVVRCLPSVPARPRLTPPPPPPPPPLSPPLFLTPAPLLMAMMAPWWVPLCQRPPSGRQQLHGCRCRQHVRFYLLTYDIC